MNTRKDLASPLGTPSMARPRYTSETYTVKTRGILGEIQLGAILEEILAPEQYETNVATIPGSSQRVEYAVKMPGVDGSTVWLPIDSKFPGDTYAHLQDAQASGDAQAVENARHALELVLRLSLIHISSPRSNLS